MSFRLPIVSCALALVLAASAGAATVRVEKDGSGDWTTLQGAVDAAATGDTILIGPGRYDDFHVSPWSPAQYLIVTLTLPKSLTFIGSDVDSVIVGPEAYQLEHIGLVLGDGAAGGQPQHFRDITYENLVRGVSAAGGTVSNCRFMGCKHGTAWYSAVAPIEVTMCTFEGLPGRLDIGYAMAIWGAESAAMSDCFVQDMAMYFERVSDYTIQNNQFPKTYAVYAFNNYLSNGVIQDCEISGQVGNQGGRLEIRDCEFSLVDTGPFNSLGCSDGTTTIIGNTFRRGVVGGATIRVAYGARLSGYGNDIYHGDEAPYVVYVAQSTEPEIDLRNNYWGTNDPDLIAEWIWDHNDDPELAGSVLFEPFSDTPLPTEK
ncbi:MAG: hypothetical protein KC561_19720, partial [Myxococcales bacterium]|nr:hypothetical protein [Myxococcales bacterium]